jgi:16S rRNA (cytosine967-C5)-methyltransferase
VTPGARHAAAVAVLDRWLAGAPVEQALTNWARGSRFAGSADRAAVRDLVFDAVRCRDSFAARGGGLSGRALVLGGVRTLGGDAAAVFTGDRYAPAPLTDAERQGGGEPEGLAALDVPPALEAPLRDSLGPDFAAVMARMQARAPLFLRVNLARGTRAEAVAALAAEGIATAPVPEVATALEVLEGARRVAGSQAYGRGLVEVQDAASQAAVALLPLPDGARVLDYCAGGGGKALAMAARAGLRVFAHDADPGRMADLPARADRAGLAVRCLTGPEAARAAPFDLVLLDVPCSGSGAWRRQAEAKWRLTEADLAAFAARQDALLDEGARLAGGRGALAYMTCSLFRAENEDRTMAFLARHADWRLQAERRFLPGAPGDGFYASLFVHRL